MAGGAQFLEWPDVEAEPVPSTRSNEDLDNLSAHKAPAVTEWLARPRQSRWHLHFTPTSSSWLNLIERWFKELTDKRLRRGVFTSVAELAEAITTWAEHWNLDPRYRSCGRPLPRTSSPRSLAAGPLSTSSKQRRTTSTTALDRFA